MSIAPASGSVFVPAIPSEPIKHKEPKMSVIENEKDRIELSAAYKQYLSAQRDYDDLRHQFDVDNLTYEEYSKMCGMLKDKGLLDIEEYDWLNSWAPYECHRQSGLLGSFSTQEFNQLSAMADSHPDPFRLEKVISYAAKKRDEGNPITFDQMLDLADPSKTYQWVKGDSVAPIKWPGLSDSDKRYNWTNVITERLAYVEMLPHIKVEDQESYIKAATKMLGILSKLKNAESHQ